MFAKVSTLTVRKSVSLEKADLSLDHITSPGHSYRVLHSVFRLILTMNGLTSSYPKTTFPPEIKLCKSFSRQLRQNLPFASPSFSDWLPQVRCQQGVRRLPVCTHCHWGRRLATSRVEILPTSQLSWTPDVIMRLSFFKSEQKERSLWVHSEVRKAFDHFSWRGKNKEVFCVHPWVLLVTCKGQRSLVKCGRNAKGIGLSFWFG